MTFFGHFRKQIWHFFFLSLQKTHELFLSLQKSYMTFPSFFVDTDNQIAFYVITEHSYDTFLLLLFVITKSQYNKCW